MNRLAAPIAFAAAVALACPEVLASPGGPARSTMASWSAAGYGQAQPVAEPAPAEPAPAPAAEYPPAPQPYADPSAAPNPQPGPGVQPAPAAPRSRRKGMMIAGWVMFGSSYLFTALVAGIIHDTCNLADRPNCKRAAANALIPVVGPFLTIPYLNTDAVTPKVFMALPGLVQLAGLTLGIIGTVQFVRDGREPRVADVDGFKLGKKLRLGVAPTRFLDGGTFTLGARF